MKYKNGEDEGCELWDGEIDEEEWNDEEVGDDVSDDEEAGTSSTTTPVSSAPPKDIPPSVVAPREDVVRFDKIGEAIKEAKNDASNSLPPYLIKLENVFANERRKLLKDPVCDGILVGELNSADSDRPQDEEKNKENEELREQRVEWQEHDEMIIRDRVMDELNDEVMEGNVLEEMRNIFEELEA